MKHISDIRKMERCKKLLWNSKRTPQPFVPFVFYHEDMYELAKEKLHIANWFCGSVGDENDAFLSCEKKFDAFCKVRFSYQDLRIKIPVMIRNQNKYDLYFLYSSCFPKESEAQSFADQLWVLNNLNIKVNNIYILHLNSEYIREEKLNVEELLVISNFLYNDKNHPGKKIAKLIKEKNRDVHPILNEIDRILDYETMEMDRTNVCTRRNKCAYFDICFPSPSKDTSIMNLVSCAYKFDLMDSGKRDISEIEFSDIEGTRHQFAQYMAAKENTTFFDTYAVENFFSSQIQYPISYLDFEWETYAYPPFTGMKPFDVLTFQYSLHIEEQEGALVHKEYLGKGDCRIEFIERLLADIPDVGSVMCFNVEGAEKLRLKQLAKQFPQYNERLQKVWERMIDLSIPFSVGLIYDNRMAGMYSLKKLVSIFTDYNYADLDISHGMEAVRNYRLMENEENEEQRKIRKELLAYCAMDTYAEYLIYHWILDRIEEYKN